jgi:hypothetical protein
MPTPFFPQSDRFRCPGEEQLAAYVDQQLIGAERERVESHLAKCNSCLQQVGFLVRHAEAKPVEPPARLVARAGRLNLPDRRYSLWTWKWAAVTAMIALATAVTFMYGPRSQPGRRSPASTIPNREIAISHPPAPPSGTPETAVRGRTSEELRPVLLSPSSGASVPARELVVRWKPVAGAESYEVRIVTGEGDLVWQERVKDSSASAQMAPLRKGQKYFVWVRAVLPDGKTQESKAVSFIGG